jgi:hypothetical protein
MTGIKTHRLLRSARHLSSGLVDVHAALRYRSGLRGGGVEYVGFYPCENLGDVAVYEAVQALLRPSPTVAPPRVKSRLAQRIVDKRPKEVALLGGGTLVGASDYLARFRAARTNAPVAAALGTGVLDPDFPDDYPEGEAVLQAWARELSSCDFVGVRGDRSLQLLADYGVEARVTGDPVFAYADTDRWDPQGGLGVNVGGSKGRTWGDESDYLAEISRYLAEFKSAGLKPEFFVVWPEDLAATAIVRSASGLEDAPVHRYYLDAERYLERVQTMEAFVGIKLHATALALCAGVPSIMLEYRPKCRELMESLSLGDSCIRTDAVTAARLDSAVRALVESVPHYRERLKGAIEVLKGSLADGAAEVRRLAGVSDDRACIGP